MKLYTTLATVYHEMYQDLFDYDGEFRQYHEQLQSQNCQKIVEFGCGTGNLAGRFLSHGYAYLGVDLSAQMLDIASKSQPKAYFLQADIQDFRSKVRFDAALITGRTISYLVTDEAVNKALKAAANALKVGGLLMFDAIDGPALFDAFDETENTLVVKNYKRVSRSTPIAPYTWTWASTYFSQDNGVDEDLGTDLATLRAFTKDEIASFLQTAGFELLTIIPKQSYAWKDDYFLGQKV